MQILKNKTMAILISLLLMISMFAIITLIPTTEAHTPVWQIPSHPYIVAVPNPVGVGQPISISMWVDRVLPSVAVHNDIRRHDYKLTITAPDGTKTTQSWPVVQDTTGIQFYQFTPTQIGTYTLLFEYAGQTYTWGASTNLIGSSAVYQNDTYLPGSRTTSVTVQQEALPAPKDSYPLPTEYWTRPIEAENTYWGTISSNWLSGAYIENRLQPQGTAPTSPHVMWTKPLDTGGVVGGTYGGILGEGFYVGRSYNQRFNNPIVMNGILYYELPNGNMGFGGGTMAVDVRTGEQVWYNEQMGASVNTTNSRGRSNVILPAYSFGYYISVPNYNQHGVIPSGLLFSSGFATAYNPTTGKIMYNVTGVPSGTEVVDSEGSILRYVWNSATRTLTQWNSSRMWTYEYQATEAGGQTPGWGITLNADVPLTPSPPTTSPPSGQTWNWNGSAWVAVTSSLAITTQSTYDWNITLATLGSGTWSINRASFDNIMLLSQGTLGGLGDSAGANYTAVSLKPESRGTLLWTKHYDAAPGNVSRSIVAWDPNAGVFVTRDFETMEYFGFSLTDGRQLWGPTVVLNDYEYFSQFHQGFAAYGNFYQAGYGGILHCWDIITGELKWTYGNGGPGNSTFDVEQSWGLRPLMIQVIADGIIYASGDEHSPNTPLYKDDLVRAINATTGKEIWTMKGWICGSGGGGQAANSLVADGFLVYINIYDMQIYSVGKGPSAMTAEAPKNAIKLGDSLVISGSVTDISAGTKQKEQAARFPNGVPVVSDLSQSAWMEYIYMQKPRPIDTSGVPITLSVVDSNGNYRDIGTTISDADGFFAFNWKPDITGQYAVYASFAGSESYWPSHAVTAFAVDSTVTTPGPTEALTQSAADTYLLPGIISIIVAIAIVGTILALLVIKKRP